MTNETIAGLKRISWLPDRDATDNGTLIAGQEWYDVEFTGGSISNVTLTDVTINGTETARNERVVTASGAVTVASDDYVIIINKTVPEVTTVNLPASPTNRRSLIIKDGAGNADTYNITINGNGHNVDEASTFVINWDWGGIEIIYNSTDGIWEIIGQARGPGNGTVTSVGMQGDNVIYQTTVTGSPITSTGTLIPVLKAVTAKSVLANPTAGALAPAFTTDPVVSGAVTGNTLVSTVATGTAPLTVASTTQVANLNAATAGTASNIVVADAAGDTTTFVMLAGSATGASLPVLTDSALTYNATTDTLSATNFSGAFSGTVTNATNIGVTDDTTTNATMYPLWVTANTGNLPAKVSSTKFTVNPSTGTFTATNLGGTLTTAAQTAITSVGTLTGGATGAGFTVALGTSTISGILGSANGGTGNGFTKFSGATTSEKTYTLPNASTTILTTNAAVTVAQGGTGLATLTANNVILGNGTSTPNFVAPGTSGNVLTSNGTTWASTASTAGVVTLPCNARLTLTSGLPVTTSDVTAAANVYVAPYLGNIIALFDGASTWTDLTFSELTISLASGYANATPYDVFAYNNSGTVAVETLAWTNETTRATALVLQNGIYVKSGATTRRYIGTFYTTSSTTTEDSLRQRYLFNYYNRLPRAFLRRESGSWNYTISTIRQANSSTTNQLNFIIGVSEDAVIVSVNANGSNSGANPAAVGLGLDSVTAINIGQGGGFLCNNVLGGGAAYYEGYPGIGKHYIAWLETAQATGTMTWFGATTTLGSTLTSGLTGQIMA